jgi:hypothetical protein
MRNIINIKPVDRSLFLLQLQNRFDSSYEHVEVVSGNAVETVSGGKMLDYLQLLEYMPVARPYQQVHHYR